MDIDPGLRFAAVDLGTSSIDVELTDGRLRPVAAYAEPADIRSGPEAILRRLGEILTGFSAGGAYERLTGLGVGLPGPVKYPDGVPVSPPTMPGWDRYPVREVLSREHRCPAAVDSDATVMGIGERHGGVARLVDDLLFLKVGTGISCGIHVAGRVYRGSDGYAGNIGHIQVDTHGPVCACGNVGCLDAVFSGAAPARGGARWIGGVLAGLVTFINPSMIVVGGGLAGPGGIPVAEIRAVACRRPLPLATRNLTVVVSTLGRRAGLVGAAVLASEVAYRRPPDATVARWSSVCSVRSR
jgi:predicted NBD/HSP70 family sugar kinase